MLIFHHQISFIELVQFIEAHGIKMQENDEDRTVGINTGHIQTLDYNLETADKEFVIQRGYNATKAFLQYYVVQNTQTKKKPRQ
ncbi:uncharacterized protein LOC106050539 isoform X3 [Biomphalaria glabrata]|uniref:Uncharacterized protein LOC106050539 isoform X3 n=1 Tax=Biomphalaria glabrata TaxID=6526 RepID=A0A9W2YL34_BIOGL|nr:uncharacterized protein LOC106050539 isoform X3 [Biomphalaria glabrata]